MSEVYSYIASAVNAKHVAWINVTNPLAGPKIYDEAVRLYKKNLNRFDSLLSAVEVKENFFYNGKPINFKTSPWPRSQDLKPLISLSFNINILKRNDLIKWGSCVGKKPFFYLLNSLDAKDIDSPEDFQICESLYKSRK